MRNHRSRRRVPAYLAKLCLTAALVASTALSAAPVQAMPHHEQQEGSCSGSGHWRLAVRHMLGHLRVTYAVSEVAPHQSWQVFLSDNGVRILATSRVSDGTGWFRVRIPTRDRRGADHIRATAVSTLDGGTCQASMTF